MNVEIGSPPYRDGRVYGQTKALVVGPQVEAGDTEEYGFDDYLLRRAQR